MVVANLRMACGGVSIWLLLGNLLEHGLKEHIDARIFLNQFRKFFKYFMQLLRVSLDVSYDAL